MPLDNTNYKEMWQGNDLRPKFDKAKCSNCDSCLVEGICPTNAFKDERLNLAYCFGCGMCANFCRKGAFEMKTGDVDLNINGENVTIPIICRQSDRLRANKLSLKLKKMLENKEFIL